MYEVERLVAVIKPTEKMLDLLRNHLENGEQLTLSEIRNDCTVLLIPAYEDISQAFQHIHSICQDIFEGELDSWQIPEHLWPTSRDIYEFNAWFDVEFHSIVYDMGETPIDEPMPVLQ